MQKAMTAAEDAMAKLEAERETLNAQLVAMPAADKIADIGRRLKAIDDELAKAEAKWLEASEAIELLSAETVG